MKHTGLWMDELAKVDFTQLEARVMAYQRQVGKSAVLGAMYGSAGRNVFGPLQMRSGYTFVNYDKRFGGVPVYKVTTKTISEIMRKDRVPHTELYYRDMDELVSMVASNISAIAWIRRSNHSDLQTAVATLIMLGKQPVILRAFEP